MKKIIILTHILILSSLFSCKKESAPEEIISNKTDTAAEDVISNKIEKEDGITYLNSNFISLCNRSLFFKNRIIEILGATSCDDVTAESLASVKTLNLRGHYPEGNRLTGLEKNDFQGFVNLQKLDLSHNELFGQDELKDNLFDH